MKIYKVTAKIWDWNSSFSDRRDYLTIEKFFFHKEDAEKWIKEHETFCYNPHSNNIAINKCMLPQFEIEEIEVE